MKVIEIINFNRELLKKLQEAGVRLEDVQYVELYSEYMYRTSQGEKVSYVVAVLSEKYSVSERTIYALVKQFQIDNGELVLSAYQRSSDANLGLPADIYHLYLMARQIELPLKSITLYLGNVHIYENNIPSTRALLAGDETVRFELNV